MTTYGVTENGFVKKSYAATVNSLHDNAKKMFGSDVDLTPGSPIKMYINLMAAEITGLWNAAEDCYNAAFLDTATGVSLTNLGKLVGAERSAAIYATGEVTFFRTTVLPAGSPRIIPSGTKLVTATVDPVSFTTTSSVYFYPVITDESIVNASDGYTISTKNTIATITKMYDDNGVMYINPTSSLVTYDGTVTFSGRDITFSDQISAGTIFYITYKPLSVTAPVIATLSGADSNVAASTITVMSNPIDFVHYVSNESGIDSGADVESDSHFRQKIIGATQAIGRATTNSLQYYISKVTGVKNVMIEDPLRQDVSSTITGNGTTTIIVPHTPIYSVSSIVGTSGGTYSVDSFDSSTGEIELSTATVTDETITVVYKYVTPGKVKIYVEGGEVGDEFTQDTIVYAIESTRAAGIQCVGYDTDDPFAHGSDTAKFSWFYRPNNAPIDLSITVYFDNDYELEESAKNTVLSKILDTLTDYINELPLNERLYRNKILQLVISSDSSIADAQITSWKITNETKPITDTYLEAGEMEIMIAQNIVLSKANEG